MDICFVIDSTGSMESQIKNSIETIKNIILKSKVYIENLKSEYSSLKIAVVGYRDHCDEKLTEHIDFTSSEKCIEFLKNLKAVGGGDTPEAVADGLNKALQLSWRNEINEKLMFLILDAPPHGREYFLGKDEYPDGCPCNIKIDGLAKKRTQTGTFS